MTDESLFNAARAIVCPNDRVAFLDRHCAGKPTLRKEVEELLAAHAGSNLLDQPPADLHRTGPYRIGDNESMTEGEGTVIGPYTLREQIGEGGFGLVFVAEQQQPVRRKVALKVIKPGMDTKQVVARFEAERQALALMDHPNIARVLDAGTTESGRPFFVMELVKGVPITEYADANNLIPRDRLGLFVQVCNAVQHAHQKGVIHRDLKPSNILVAPHDGVPVVKVIDFGVAKALGQSLTEKTIYTRFAQMIGTPLYMSPEQAEVNQLDVDTRSDVYSLGVLLYELLTGTTPFDRQRFAKAAFDEIRRIIKEEEPPRPSTRLTSMGATLTAVSARRGTDAGKLAGLVRGELDWIVMRCLEKDRSRRYDSAAGLAKDVQRFLADEPVEARQASAWYRFQKMARRNKAALTTAAVVAAALLVGTAVSAWQAVTARRAEAAAIAERDEKEKARQAEAEQRDATVAANEQLSREQAQRRADQYAWDMQALRAIWDAGNVSEARRMLDRQPQELRGFEWHFWNRQTHTEAAVFTLPDATDTSRRRREAGWAFSPDGSRVALVSTTFSNVTRNRRGDEHATLKVWDVAARKLLLARPLAEDENVPFITGQELALSRDGKVVLVSGTLITDGRPDLTRGGRPVRPNNGWVRVLEVDSGKVLFDSRKEPGVGRVSETACMNHDGRRLVTHETFRPESGPVVTICKVWDLTTADRKPVTIEGASILGFSPDGSRLVGRRTVDRMPTTMIWDATTGTDFLSFDAMHPRTVTFSPKGTLLAGVAVAQGMAGPSVGKLMVYDAHNGKELSAFDLGVILPTNGRMPRLLFTPDESQIAFSLSNPPGAFENARTEWSIIDTKTGKRLRTFDDPVIGLNIPFGQRTPMLLSDDGSQIIHAVENVIHTMDPMTGLPVHTLRGSVTALLDMVALPNCKLRTVESGGTIRDWNLKPVAPLFVEVAEEERRGPGGYGQRGLPQQSVSADGAWVAWFYVPTGDNDQVGSVRVCDTAGKRSFELRPSPRGTPPSGFPSTRVPYLSADGKRVALFRGYADPERQVGGAKNDPADYPPPDVIVWDVASQKILFHREFPRTDAAALFTRLVAFSPDGTVLAIVERVGDGKQPKGKLTLLDIATDGAAKTIETPGAIVWGSFSPDGTRLQCAVGTPTEPKITIFDTTTGNCICTIEGESLARVVQRDPWDIFNLPKSWNPDGTRLAVAEPQAARIHLFDTATGKLVKTLDAPSRGGFIPPTATLAFSPDGRRIAVVVRERMTGLGSTVNVLDTDSGKELLSLPMSRRSGPLGEPLRFSPDGHRLIHFGSETTSSIGAKGQVTKLFVRVTTWDATPLPEPNRP